MLIVRKNQPEVSEKVMSIPRVLSLAPRPTTGSAHNYLNAEKKFKVYGLSL